MMYKGLVDPEELLAEAEIAGGVDFATTAYGVGNWYFTEGQPERTQEIFEKIVATDVWAAFGYIAAEADLARWQRATDQPGSSPSR